MTVSAVRGPDEAGFSDSVMVNQNVDALVARAVAALEDFERRTQEQVDHVVAEAAGATLRRCTDLAALAVTETGRGIVEDKAVKNAFACEHVVRQMVGMRTVGVISRDVLTGLVQIAAPVGVVCAVTPMTNPTSTVIFKALLALKTRNPIVFSFHHKAQLCSREAARTVRDAAVAAGAPEHCIQWVSEPSRAATARLMRHDDTALILATGGNRMVKAAYSVGKPALGVGSGNVPVYVDHTAEIPRAAHDIVLSKTFDNSMVCSSEQTMILDTAVADDVLSRLIHLGAYVVSSREKALLERYLFGADTGKPGAGLNAEAVGRSTSWIAGQAGFTVPDGTSIILAELPTVTPEERLAREKLCPVLAFTRALSRDDGIRQAQKVLELGGLGHTAAIHTNDERLAEKFALCVKAVRVVWNSPSSHGGIGGIYNAFTPSLSLGCGSYGGNSVSDNIHAAHLINIRRLGRRTTGT